MTSPEKCKNKECDIIVKWQIFKNNNTHKFIISAKVGNKIPIETSWTAIAISTDPFMGEDEVIMCKHLPAEAVIEHYSNTGKFAPTKFEDPKLGIRNEKITTNNDFLICSFERDIRSPRGNIQDIYYDLANPFFLLAAFGPLGPNLESIIKLC